MADWILYVFFLIIILLTIRSLMMGVEKMFKLIIGNYLLAVICYALGESIGMLIDFLAKTPEASFAGISFASWESFFANGQITLVLVVYALLVWLIYAKSTFSISLPKDFTVQKLLSLIFVPLTVFSFLFTIQIALMGTSSVGVFAELQSSLQAPALQIFLSKAPLWMCLHGILVLLFCCKFHLAFKSKASLDI